MGFVLGFAKKYGFCLTSVGHTFTLRKDDMPIHEAFKILGPPLPLAPWPRPAQHLIDLEWPLIALSPDHHVLVRVSLWPWLWLSFCQGSTDKKTSTFRIVATGLVTGLDKTLDVVKKLKLTGTPYKIFKNTAFMKGMFSSLLEVQFLQTLLPSRSPQGLTSCELTLIRFSLT